MTFNISLLFTRMNHMKSFSILLILSMTFALISGCGDSSTVIQPTGEAPATETDKEMETDDYEKAMKNIN
ncbi:hypothetical protein Poly21_38740 [Allorhodopirellula heiligendammensis]|uniref:Secreted protein n=2 Tax=Allorhodopirellula heiligendammensis TaxID=2714739 RepID=A0A5C6C1D9_9BACT|nr:hypothetical protein Poly21_38740 [Allorhodopirellula heiligendammensis]